MAFYDGFLSKAALRLGFIRRSDLNNFLPASSLFAGETFPGQENMIYANWSEYQLQKLAVTNPWVYSSIKLIGNEVALGIMEVQRRNAKDGEKWTAEIDHDFERIVEGKPNPYMGQFYTWLYQAMWLFIQGEAYWMLVPDTQGQLREMYPLPANRVIPVPDPTGERLYSGFAYTPVVGTRPKILLPEQVCYHHFPNPFNYRRGMSPISAYLLSLQLDTESRKFDLDDFKNGLTLKHLISMGADKTERDRQSAQADLERGQVEGKRYMLIRAGQIDVKPLDNRRGENGAVRQLTRDECNYVFGIPDSVRNTQATEASAKVGWDVLKSATIWPLMCFLAEDFTAQVIHRYYELDLRVVFGDIRPKNIELELRQKDSKRAAQTYNEARADEGLDPHPIAEVGDAPYSIAAQVYLEKFKAESAETVRQQAETMMQQQQREQQQAQLTEGEQPEQVDELPEPEQPEDEQPPEAEQGKAAKAAPDDTPEAITEYEANLIRLIEQAQNGELDRNQFEELVGSLTEAVLAEVFKLGAKGKLSKEAQQVLKERIEADLASVPNLADDVFAGKFKEMDEGGLGWNTAARVGLWATFAFATYQMSKIWGDEERRLEWRWSPEAQHCGDCEELNGQVRTAREWRESGLYPGNPSLACQGFCRCQLVEVS